MFLLKRSNGVRSDPCGSLGPGGYLGFFSGFPDSPYFSKAWIMLTVVPVSWCCMALDLGLVLRHSSMVHGTFSKCGKITSPGDL